MITVMILFSFVSLFAGELSLLERLTKANEQKMRQENLEYFRNMKSGEEPVKFQYFLKKNPIYKKVFDIIQAEAVVFPIKNIEKISYGDSFGGERTFLGNRKHEGCDLMSKTNIRGEIPVFSMSDGILENKGWLTLGGWRLGIRTKEGVYFYYAHLDSYANQLEVGQEIKAGQFLGFMGDSGYGEEGTVGQFDVHLHLGIYIDESMIHQEGSSYGTGEISINPYWILKSLEIVWNGKLNLADVLQDGSGQIETH